jgi:hypothetical protein
VNAVSEAEVVEGEIVGGADEVMIETEILIAVEEEGSTDVVLLDTPDHRHRVDETPETEVRSVVLHLESLIHTFRVVEAEEDEMIEEDSPQLHP